LGKEKNRFVQNREEQIENKETKIKINSSCVFGCFAGHRRRRETEKRNTFPI